MIGSDSILAALSDSSLMALSKAVEVGQIHGASPAAVLQSVAGPKGPELAAWVASLEMEHFRPSQIGRILRSVVEGRQRRRFEAPDLVVSGPDLPGVPTSDTYEVVQSLFQEAQEEVLIAGYAFHNGKLLFERLAERQKQKPDLRILFHVDVPRKPGDTTKSESLVLRFAEDFRARHWPWNPAPELYFDPRAMSPDSKTRASLHAKVLVIDRRILFLTSANFTEAAHQRNIEMGLLSRAPELAGKVASYFEGLREAGALSRIPTV
jgi:phosphatidylserine/phosphatidylglycerophosphate/cardiolipin synthase-like enzyme